MNEGKEIRFIDLFSGIGGFKLGLEKTKGFKGIWSCDIDPFANQIYLKRFKPKKGTHYTGDVRRVNLERLPNFDLLCAGFPCQSFSVAGKRRGFQDTRGTLFFEICRIAKAKRPSLLLLENVKGLLNHDNGRTFTIILQSLEELGYWIEWQVLNSKYFVPQSRERIFIIGHLRGSGGRPLFPTSYPIQNRYDKTSKERGSIVPTISTKQDRGSPFLVQVRPIITPNRLNKRQHGKRLKNHDEDFYTITSQDRHGILISNNRSDAIRFLTPLELERLQGFPDNWTKGIPLAQRYKCLGNAVTVPVIEFLGRKIKQIWDKEEIEK